MRETLRPLEQSPQERLQDEISRLKRWIDDASSVEALGDIITDLDNALEVAKERRDFDATEIEGTIAHLKNEARAKEDRRKAKKPTERVNRIEGVPARLGDKE